MTDPPPAMSTTRRTGVLLCALLAIVLPGASHLLFGDVDINFADEGYLWYGVQRTAAGEVPLRDFQSYDPGRYLWCAAFVPLFGDGIVAVRLSAAMFQAVGLFFGLLAACRALPALPALPARPASGRRWLLVPIALALAAWTFPRHKVFEPAVAMMTVYAAVRLIETAHRPSLAPSFAAGAFAGIAAMIGRNLGVYALGAFAVVTLWAGWRMRAPRTSTKLAAGAAGVVAGYAPMLAACAFVPGFLGALVDSIEVIFRQGTNLPQPWRWPWTYTGEGSAWADMDTVPGASPAFARATDVGLAFAYLLPVVVLPLGVAAAWWTRDAETARRRRLLVAASITGALFIHHAAVRSQVYHLAQSFAPVLLACIALPAAFARVPRAAWWCAGAAFFALIGLAVVHPDANPSFTPVQPGRSSAEYRAVSIGGEVVRLTPFKIHYLDRIRHAIERRVGADELVFIAPTRPAFYPLLGKPSPTWAIYFFWPDATDEEQERIVRQLDEKRVRWALILGVELDDRDDLRFDVSHPRVWRWIEEHFEVVEARALPAGHYLLRRTR